MKKALVAIVAVVATFCFVSCKGKKADGGSSGISGAGKPVNLTFSTQEVGTGLYNVSTALQGVMLKALPAGSTIDLSTNSPGGVGAPVIVDNEDCDIAVANAGPSQWSVEMSEADYEYGGHPNARALGGGLGHAFTNIMFTQKFVDKTGIRTFEEIIEKRYPVKLITKKNGSLGELTAERVIEACGISVKEFMSFASWEKTGTDAIKSGLQDDIYDCTIDHVDAGQSTTTEICLTHAMFFPQLSEKTRNNMEKMGYAPITIEANTWNGQTYSIESVGSQQNVLVPASMSDDVAYLLTKGMCEHVDELSAAVSSLKWFDPKVAGKKEFCGAPLHPGAIRYYKEMGYAYDE